MMKMWPERSGQQTLTEDSVCGICEQFLEFN